MDDNYLDFITKLMKKKKRKEETLVEMFGIDGWMN